MKKLSICIPTYNRSNELAKLSSSFLIHALDKYNEFIEVIVSDNSDDAIAGINARLLEKRIVYSKNPVNLGYSGNIRQCITLAHGQYLWIISDDDEIRWDGFLELMDLLLMERGNLPDVIFAPIETSTIHGEKIIINGREDWNCDRNCKFENILSKGQIPFLFIASGVIKNEFSPEGLDRIAGIDNDYLHVLMYCSRLTNESDVAFLERGLVEYKTSSTVRFSIYSISKSIQDIIKYIDERFKSKIQYSCIYSEHLKWLLYHRAGISKVYKGDVDRWKLIRMLRHNMSARSIFLCFALIIPRVTVKLLFAITYAWKSIIKSGKINILDFFIAVSRYWKILSGNSLKTKN